jgi:hypothetical protein
VILVAKVLVLIFCIFTSVLANIYRRGRAPWVYVKWSIEILPVSTGTCCWQMNSWNLIWIFYLYSCLVRYKLVAHTLCHWHLGSTAYIIPIHITFLWTGYDFHKGTCVVDTLIILKLGILTLLVAIGMHILDISLKHSWLVIDMFMIDNHIFQPHNWVCHRHSYIYWTSRVHIWYS